MPTFEITAPNGKTYEVTAPQGATQDQVLSYVQSQMGVESPKIDWTPSISSTPGSTWEGLKTAIPGASKVQAAIAATTARPFVDEPWKNLYEQAKGELKDEREQAFRDNPYAFSAGAVGGGVVTSLGALNAAKAAAPSGSAALAAWAAQNPYKAASLAGGVSGGIYGAAESEGTPGERAVQTGGSALAGGVLSPLALYGINSVSSGARNSLSALKNLFGQSDEIADDVARSDIIPDISEITQKPISETPELSTVAQKRNVLNLTPGQVSGDARILDVEEQARQRLLGQKAKEAIDALDEGVQKDIRTTVQSLIGKKTGSSKDILEVNVDQFRNSAESMKKAASKLTEARDEALVSTVGDVRKIGPSLGKALDDVLNDPKLKFEFKRNPEATGLVREYIDAITEARSKGNTIELGELNAIRGKISDFMGANQGTQAGRLAGKISDAFDNWLENGLTPEMILEGDPNVGNLIKMRNKAWREYYTLFEGNVRLENIATDFRKTPLEFVDSITTNKKEIANDLRMMVKALPETEKQQFLDNAFSGFVAKAFEKAQSSTDGPVKVATLRNSLNDLLGSDHYKLILASPERTDVLTKLVSDLDALVKNTNRKDVWGPSGGMVLRGVQQLGKLPIPGFGAAAQGATKIADAQAANSSRITFNRALKQAGKEIMDRAGKSPVYNPDLALTGVITGTVTGQQADDPVRKAVK